MKSQKARTSFVVILALQHTQMHTEKLQKNTNYIQAFLPENTSVNITNLVFMFLIELCANSEESVQNVGKPLAPTKTYAILDY